MQQSNTLENGTIVLEKNEIFLRRSHESNEEIL